MISTHRQNVGYRVQISAIVFVLAVLQFWVESLQAAVASTPKLHAVFIQNHTSKYIKLPHYDPKREARAFRRLAQNITTLGGKVSVLRGQEVTRHNVIDLFRRLGRESTPDQSLVFVFSGAYLATKEDQDNSGYYLFHDLEPDYITYDGLTIGMLKRLLESTRIKKQLILIQTLEFQNASVQSSSLQSLQNAIAPSDDFQVEAAGLTSDERVVIAENLVASQAEPEIMAIEALDKVVSDWVRRVGAGQISEEDTAVLSAVEIAANVERLLQQRTVAQGEKVAGQYVVKQSSEAWTALEIQKKPSKGKSKTRSVGHSSSASSSGDVKRLVWLIDNNADRYRKILSEWNREGLIDSEKLLAAYRVISNPDILLAQGEQTCIDWTRKFTGLLTRATQTYSSGKSKTRNARADYSILKKNAQYAKLVSSLSKSEWKACPDWRTRLSVTKK